MQSDSGAEAGRQFSGMYTWMLVRFLRARTTPDEIEASSATPGEVRSADELFDLATWSSYDQFRRLLEVTEASVRTPTSLARAPRAAASPIRRCPR